MDESILTAKPAFKARAVLLGERIDIRAFRGTESLATVPLTVAVKDGGVAILFRFGVVVFFDVTAAQQAVFLDDIRRFVGGIYPAPETEEIEIRIEPGAREGVSGEAISLERASIERLQVIADILSKSVILALYESLIAGNFDRVEPLARDLEQTGHIGANARDLLRHIGAMLLTEHLMVGRVAVREKPELLWEHPVLEGLFIRLEDEFEIKERHDALEHKLNLISHIAQTLLQWLQSRRSLRLELYIVILIIAEILLTVYTMISGSLH